MKEIPTILFEQFVNINLDIYTELDHSILKPYRDMEEIIMQKETFLKNNNLSLENRKRIENEIKVTRNYQKNYAAMVNLHLRGGATRQVIIERDFYKAENIELKRRLELTYNNFALLIKKLPDPKVPDKENNGCTSPETTKKIQAAIKKSS